MTHEFSVSQPWGSKTADAISRRDGVALKECIVSAVSGSAASLTNDSPSTIRDLITSLYRCIQPEVGTQGHSGDEASAAEANLSECTHCVETLVRVAVTGAIAAYQRDRSVIYDNELSELEKECTEAELLSRSVNNTLVRGMLFAFEAFQEVHSMKRTHYPPRRSGKTVGTVGWDTLVLLYFVHYIPQIAREASGDVVDEVTGEVVRQWRKLLIAVQNADSHEAPEASRRRGTLSIANGLLMILFGRYNTHQCNVVVNAVEHAEKLSVADPTKSIIQPSQHMTSEVIAYLYFKGRLALYGQRFEEGLAALRQAYNLLPPFASASRVQCRNKYRVRFYLCMTCIITGRLIPSAVLQEDEVLQPMLTPLIGSLKRGDPVAFSNALDSFSSTFRRRGVYLLLQQCMHRLCSLFLLARVHTAIEQLGGDNSRIPFALLERAQREVIREGLQERQPEGGMAPPPSADSQMALRMSQLIATGLIRGYISYEHQVLVLSKKLPFPTLVATIG